MINKYKIKQIIKKFIQIVVVLNIILYMIFYQRYVLNAPDTHKEARIDMINALIIHNVYFLLVKAGIDFQSPIVQPIIKLREIFYKKGLEALPKNDAEKAIWFHKFEEMPYNLTNGGFYGSVVKNYGKKFGDKFLEDIFKNIILLSDNELLDKNFRDKSHLSIAFFALNQAFIFDYKAISTEVNFSDKNIIAFTKDEEMYKKLFLLHGQRAKFVEKYKDTSHFRNAMNKKSRYNDMYSLYNFNNVFLNTFILFYSYKNKIFTTCKVGKKYFKEIFVAKNNLRQYMKEVNLSKNNTQYEENFFIKLKIQNTRYDSSKTANPLRMILHCNYDDIFIKNGN